MTLTKAIEAAIVAMSRATPHLGWSNNAKKAAVELEKSLAALPDKPMTDQEIVEYISEYARNHEDALISSNAFQVIRLTLRALKAANVLYVKD